MYGTVGTVVEFPVSFRSDGEPALVSHAPDSPDGLRASDVIVTGTAPGISSVAVSGGPGGVPDQGGSADRGRHGSGQDRGRGAQ